MIWKLIGQSVCGCDDMQREHILQLCLGSYCWRMSYGDREVPSKVDVMKEYEEITRIHGSATVATEF